MRGKHAIRSEHRANADAKAAIDALTSELNETRRRLTAAQALADQVPDLRRRLAEAVAITDAKWEHEVALAKAAMKTANAEAKKQHDFAEAVIRVAGKHGATVPEVLAAGTKAITGAGLRVTPVDEKEERDWARANGLQPPKRFNPDEIEALLGEELFGPEGRSKKEDVA